MDVNGITGTTQRAAIVIVSCLGVTLMDHLIMVEITVATSWSTTGSKSMIVIEIVSMNQICETPEIHVCLRTENETHVIHEIPGIETVTEMVAMLMTEEMWVILKRMPLKDM